MYCHMRYTIVVPEEGNRLLPQFPQCDMFVPWEALDGRHPATEMCDKGNDKKCGWWVEEEAHTGASSAFQDYRWPLEAVS